MVSVGEMMALTPDRSAEIDAELQQIRDYLASLIDEIDDRAKLSNGALHAAAVHALGAISMLRHSLETDQGHERK